MCVCVCVRLCVCGLEPLAVVVAVCAVAAAGAVPTVWNCSVSDATCYLEPSASAAFFTIPLAIVLLLSILSTAYAYFRLSKGVPATEPARRRLLKRYLIYVFIFCVCWAGPVLHRLFARTSSALRFWDSVRAAFCSVV